MPTDVDSRASDDVVRSLERGLEVIEVMSRAQTSLTLADISRLCDTTRATARRLVLTLKELGYVAFDGYAYSLRPRVMDLGDAYLSGLGLPQVAHPHLARLAATVQDTCSLTVLDEFDVVYVDRVRASRLMTVNIDIGTRFPAYATSTGRILLAALPEESVEDYLSTLEAEPLTEMTTTSAPGLREEISRARREGFAIANQELDMGLRSVAAPVRASTGAVVAAVVVSTQVTRTPLDILRTQVVPQLLETATSIGTDFSALRDEKLHRGT